jgi:hypothetical protein
MSPSFAKARAGEVDDVAGLVGERVNGWIRSYPSGATSSALRDGVIINGRPVGWAWAIPGASEYLVVEFSDSHKQYVARTELPELATPASAAVVTSLVAPVVAPDARTTLASPLPVISAAKAEDPAPEHANGPSNKEPSNQGEVQQSLPDIAALADEARMRVFAWIRSCPLNATSCALGDGSRIPGRPVGWAWAIPGTVDFMVVEFSDGHKQYLSPADLP